MKDITQDLLDILQATYGRDVRQSIHDGLSDINDNALEALSNASKIGTGTAVSSVSSPSTGFKTKDLYINTTTYDLWKCTGTNTWVSQGNIKGADGARGADGEPGQAGQDGQDGENGSMWYKGTAITGTSSNPTVFSESGIANANANDMYVNSSTGAFYQCVTGGIPTVATWSYYMTVSGGGGGGASTWNDLSDKPFNTVGTNGLKVTSNALDVDFDKVQKSLANTTETATAIEDTDNLLVGAKKSPFSLIKSTLKTYFDTLYDKIASTTVRGTVKPDGSTITVTADGTISSSGGGHVMINNEADLMSDTTNTKVVSNGVIKAINEKIESFFSSTLNIATTSDLAGETFSIDLYSGDTLIQSNYIEGVFGTDGTCVKHGMCLGDYHIAFDYGGSILNVSAFTSYDINLYSTINITTTLDALFGQTVTVTKGTYTVSGVFDNSGACSLNVRELGQYSVACSTYSNIVNVLEFDTTYNVIVGEYELIPTMTSNTTPLGTASCSNNLTTAYYAFNNDPTLECSYYYSANTYVMYMFDENVTVRKILYKEHDESQTNLANITVMTGNHTVTFSGSLDGTNWFALGSVEITNTLENLCTEYEITCEPTLTKYIKAVPSAPMVRKSGNANKICNKLQCFGN